VEANVFPQPLVQQELDRYVHVKLYTDAPEPEGSKNLKIRDDEFKSNDLPLYVILDTDRKEVTRLNVAERDPKKFAAFLREGVDLSATPATASR